MLNTSDVSSLSSTYNMDFRHFQDTAIIWSFILLFLTVSSTFATATMSNVTSTGFTTGLENFTYYESVDSSMSPIPNAVPTMISTQQVELSTITVTSMSFSTTSATLTLSFAPLTQSTQTTASSAQNNESKISNWISETMDIKTTNYIEIETQPLYIVSTDTTMPSSQNTESTKATITFIMPTTVTTTTTEISYMPSTETTMSITQNTESTPKTVTSLSSILMTATITGLQNITYDASVDSSMSPIPNAVPTMISTQQVELSTTTMTSMSFSTTSATLTPSFAPLTQTASSTQNNESKTSNWISETMDIKTTDYIETETQPLYIVSTDTTMPSSQNTESTKATITFIMPTTVTTTTTETSYMPSTETAMSITQNTESTPKTVTSLSLILMTATITATISALTITETTPTTSSLTSTETALLFSLDTETSSTTAATVTTTITKTTSPTYITTSRQPVITFPTMIPESYSVRREYDEIPPRHFDDTPLPGDVNVTLTMNVVVMANYTKDLEDHHSELFLSYQQNFTFSLREVYRIVAGFMDVNVSGFRDGASNTTNTNRVSGTGDIIVDHEVILSGNTTDNKTLDTIQEVIGKNITHGELAGFSVNKNATLMAVTSNIEKFRSEINNLCLLIKHPCSNGYYCYPDKDFVVCKSLCGLPGMNKCEIHGQCQPASHENTTECRCVEDDDYLYRGTYCENKIEKLKSDTKYMIAIIAGVSGGILVILFVLVTIVICILRRRKKPDLASEQLAIPMWIRAMEGNLAPTRAERPPNDYVRNRRWAENTYDEIPADETNRVLPRVRLHGYRSEDSGYTDLVDRGYLELGDVGGYETPKKASYIHAIDKNGRNERSAYGSSPVQYDSGDETDYRGTNNQFSKPAAGARTKLHVFEDRSGYVYPRSGYMRRDYQAAERNQY